MLLTIDVGEMKFFDKVAAIDLAIRQKDPESAVKEIAPLLKDEVLRGYFFDQLSNPKWIPSLRDTSLLAPPDYQEATSEWTATQYLVNVAEAAPQEVRDIILEIEFPRSERILRDITKVAINLPSGLAADWAQRITPFIWGLSDFRYPLLPRVLGDLVSNLASDGEVKTALRLARAILAFRLPQKPRDATTYFSTRPNAKVDSWEYENILEKVRKGASETGGMALIELLVSLLRDYIEADADVLKRDKPRDFSHFWRQKVETSGDNIGHDLASGLIDAIRDESKELTKHQPDRVEQIVDILESQEWLVFERLLLNYLRSFPELGRDHVERKVSDYNLFCEEGVMNEYLGLVSDTFQELSDDTKNAYMAWVANGPDIERFTKNWTKHGSPPSEEKRHTYICNWKILRLRPIRDSLGPEWREKYEALKQVVDEPSELTPTPSSTTTYIGPTSPKTEKELRSMAVEDVIDFILNWEPEDGHHRHSPEGLGRHLAPVVASDAAGFAGEIERLKDADPTYSRYVIRGLTEAVDQGEKLPWDSLFKFLEWVIHQPREIETTVSQDLNSVDRDGGWKWTRKEIARLLGEGLTQQEEPIPFDLREEVWRVLLPLTDDSEPTPEHEEKYGEGSDALTTSINTVRGEAMHTTVKFGFWVRSNLDQDERKWTPERDIAEVIDVWDDHLNLQKEKSLAIRAVYGQRLPQLLHLAESWVLENLGRIFPESSEKAKYRETAWKAYIQYSNPHPMLLDILHNEYLKSVDLLDVEQTDIGISERRLAEHLMVFLWIGELDLSDQKSLLTRFFGKANEKLRSHALKFVATQFNRRDIDSDAVTRFKQLWEWRLDQSKSGNVESYEKELGTFGKWFSLEQFSPEWRIDQLQQILVMNVQVENDYQVLYQLGEMSVEYPKKTLDCLQIFAEQESLRSSIAVADESAGYILENSIDKGGDLKRQAEDLIHLIGSNGLLVFRDLLQFDAREA